MHNIPSLQGRVLNLDLEHYFDDTKRAHGKELGKRKNEDSIFLHIYVNRKKMFIYCPPFSKPKRIHIFLNSNNTIQFKYFRRD